jgi:hypothetical protein
MSDATQTRTPSKRGDRLGQSTSLRLRFRTATGSLYEIDYGAGTWRRVTKTGRSGRLRSEGGELVEQLPLQLGKCARIVFVPPDVNHRRLLVTSPVVSIEPVRPLPEPN